MAQQQLGILDVQQVVASFLGAVVGTSKQSHRSPFAHLSAILGGTASAAYLTPIVGDILHVTNAKYMLGLSFLLGTTGMRSVEIVADKLDLKRSRRRVD